MALSGAWGTESLPGCLWPAGPRAAVTLPDLGFQAGWLGQAGWAGAWAADRAWGWCGEGSEASCSSGVEQRAKSSLNPFCSCGAALLPGPGMAPLSDGLTALGGACETGGLQHTGRRLLGLVKDCSDSLKHPDLWPSGEKAEDATLLRSLLYW